MADDMVTVDDIITFFPSSTQINLNRDIRHGPLSDDDRHLMKRTFVG